MATLIELCQRGDLFKVDPALHPRQQEERIIYASQRLKDWLMDGLPKLGSTWDIETSPIEQVDALIAAFASGELMTYQHRFRHINHVADGIWELKTADVRIFGWFHAKDCFVGHVGNATQLIKQHNLYHGHAGEVAHFRQQLGLDEPKYIAGEDPSNVISNIDFP